jgi:flagellin-like protein
MRGITPIIAIIILLLITVSIAGTGYFYISMYTGMLMNEQVEVTSAICSGGQVKVIVKNSGAGTVNSTRIKIFDKRTGLDITNHVQWAPDVTEVLRSSEILEFTFSDSSAIGKDTSGNGNDGTPHGAASFTASGKRGGGASFDGINSYIETKDFSWPSYGLFSISAWVKPALLTTQTFIGKPSPTWEYSFYANSATMNFIYWNPGGGNAITIFAPDVFAANRWTHVAVVYNGSIAKLYVNGIQVTFAANVSSSFMDRTVAVQVGAGYCGGQQRYFNGTLDEVRFYNRTLSPEEILALGNNEVNILPGSFASFMHYCDQNMCSYTITAGSSKDAYVSC